ncbi:MAG: hypothetical protein AABY22_35130 [Nanoarchaeota archaeon]
MKTIDSGISDKERPQEQHVAPIAKQNKQDQYKVVYVHGKNGFLNVFVRSYDADEGDCNTIQEDEFNKIISDPRFWMKYKQINLLSN